MTCQDLERDLESFLDGELLASDRKELEEHIYSCASCQRLVHTRRELRLAIGAAASSPCPPALRTRIECGLDQEDAARRKAHVAWFARPLAQSALLLAGGAVAAMLVMPWFDRLSERLNERPLVVDAMISRHQLRLPLDVTGEPDKVRNWFTGKVPFLVPPPRLEPVASLQGGRLANLGDREAVLLRYDHSGHAISVFVFDPQGLNLKARRRMIENREVLFPEASGYQVAVFRDHGLGYAVTSTLDEHELLKVVSAMVGGR